ncbi:hypothetical protein [Bacillus kwashiorkori]|uniref:hypothetical protein n=1 Tax=Bacillus kwashiorkori TaxID=1522318 RepID=UPI00078198B4|nr:hypothetical protein [Bacillus kwashiorkori]
MNKKLPLIIFCLVFLTGLLWFLQTEHKVSESITYFPIDETITFTDAKTEIKATKEKENTIKLEVHTFSNSDQETFLRQDITFIYQNGRLIGSSNQWRENSKLLKQRKKITLKEPSLIEALSFHHAEIHKDGNIFSAQSISNDKMYVFFQNNKGSYYFNTAGNDLEKIWQEKLDARANKVIMDSLKKATDTFQLNLDYFTVLSLMDLPNYATKPLPNFSQQQTNKLIGQLSEGIYKNYFLGIRKKDGTFIKPLGSTIPFILLSKNKQSIYVVFETKEGESILLKQTIQ